MPDGRGRRSDASLPADLCQNGDFGNSSWICCAFHLPCRGAWRACRPCKGDQARRIGRTRKGAPVFAKKPAFDADTSMFTRSPCAISLSPGMPCAIFSSTLMQVVPGKSQVDLGADKALPRFRSPCPTSFPRGHASLNRFRHDLKRIGDDMPDVLHAVEFIVFNDPHTKFFCAERDR